MMSSLKDTEAVLSVRYDSDAIMDSIDDKLREKIMKVLLEDPNFETIRLAEGYLVDCLERAIKDPNENVIRPFLENTFSMMKSEIIGEIEELRCRVSKIERKLMGSSYDYENFGSLRCGIDDIRSHLEWLEKVVFKEDDNAN